MSCLNDNRAIVKMNWSYLNERSVHARSVRVTLPLARYTSRGLNVVVYAGQSKRGQPVAYLRKVEKLRPSRVIKKQPGVGYNWPDLVLII